MQVLTDQLKTMHPGVTIYGIGDAAHKLETSGHNEDDTIGVRAEDQDADNIPEHRAIDVMLGAKFTHGDATDLALVLATIPANRARLLYVIYNRQIWSRSRDWVARPYTGSNPHIDHVHISGEADDDANESPWVLGGLEDMGFTTEEAQEVLAHLRTASMVNWATTNRVYSLIENHEFCYYTIGNEELLFTNPADGQRYSRCETNRVHAVLKELGSKLDSIARMVEGIDGIEPPTQGDLVAAFKEVLAQGINPRQV